jgi:hypothetical protein
VCPSTCEQLPTTVSTQYRCQNASGNTDATQCTDPMPLATKTCSRPSACDVAPIFPIIPSATNGVCQPSLVLPNTQTAVSPTYGCAEGQLGTSNGMDSNGNFSWTCIGANGGATTTCNASLVQPYCGLTRPFSLANARIISTNATSPNNPWTKDTGDCSFTCNPDYTGANCETLINKTQPKCPASTIAGPTSSKIYNTLVYSCPSGGAQVAPVSETQDLLCDAGYTPNATKTACTAPTTPLSGACRGSLTTPNKQSGTPQYGCDIGTVSATTTPNPVTGTFSWSCNGLNGGASTSCNGQVNVITSVKNTCSASLPSGAGVMNTTQGNPTTPNQPWVK